MHRIFLTAAALVLLSAFAMRGTAASKVYRFRCPKSNQVFEYSTGAAPKCPTHGAYHLIRVHD